MQAAQSTYNAFHTALTKQANQTPIHTRMIFAIRSVGQTGGKWPRAEWSQYEEREWKRDVLARKERL